jgi:hypothetical protein
VIRDTVVPATAVQSGRIHTASETAWVLDVTRSRVAARLVMGARAGHAAALPNVVAPPQPSMHAPVSGGGLAAGSSSSSGGVPLGLISALILILLLHWFTLSLVRERWRATVFLALPERPG